MNGFTRIMLMNCRHVNIEKIRIRLQKVIITRFSKGKEYPLCFINPYSLIVRILPDLLTE